jgi:hypothetical protein
LVLNAGWCAIGFGALDVGITTAVILLLPRLLSPVASARR